MLVNPLEALTIPLPEWVNATVRHWPKPLETDLERMDLAIELSRLNVDRGGGPFAALVFSGDEWLGAGVNRVVDTGFSIAHAEILAMMTAQREKRGRLADVGRPLSLVTTTEPCCQCFGALIWAGVEHLVCGATTSDAEEVGFDEGPKPANWVQILQQRGLSVVREIERNAARSVLERYVQCGGELYGQPIPRGDGRCP
jgi:tRNA(Arg) A34 adenosine deaminase TadA